MQRKQKYLLPLLFAFVKCNQKNYPPEFQILLIRGKDFLRYQSGIIPIQELAVSLLFAPPVLTPASQMPSTVSPESRQNLPDRGYKAVRPLYPFSVRYYVFVLSLLSYPPGHTHSYHISFYQKRKSYNSIHVRMPIAVRETKRHSRVRIVCSCRDVYKSPYQKADDCNTPVNVLHSVGKNK